MNRNCTLWAALAAALLGGCSPSSGVPAAHTSAPEEAQPEPPDDNAAITRWDDLMPAQDNFQRPAPQIGLARGRGMEGIGGLIDDTGSGTLPDQVIDHSSPNRAAQFGSSAVIAGVEGQQVELDGYVVPLGSNDQGLVDELLFVPFYGACIHVPPPPPNQIIHVTLATPLPLGALWDPYHLSGRLRIQRFDADIASASYDVAAAVVSPVSG